MDRISHHRLCELVHYNPLSGRITRLTNGKTYKIGDAVTAVDSTGYVYLYLDGRKYHAHRIIWFYVYKIWSAKKSHLDHKNRNKTDNRIKNLRIATPSQNHVNCPAQVHSKTQQRGIHRHACGRYRVQLQKDNASIHVGYFNTLRNAVIARDAAYRKFHGEFACL